MFMFLLVHLKTGLKPCAALILFVMHQEAFTFHAGLSFQMSSMSLKSRLICDW